CTNAFHAMEDQGGTLKVTLQVADTVPLELQEEKTTDDEIFIELSVSDTGQGIGPDIISHIFDPYFTTKEQGKGTGMGLAIIYGIVKDYGGTITVDTQLGKGTTFHVYLPQRTGTAAPAPVDEELSFEGKERILFVDDEEILATMGKVMLERLGYHVTAKQSSLEALEAFQNQADEFDLVVTDLTMPDITGVELARMMLQIRPDIPIILCTGYSSTVNEDVAKAQGVKGFALKPLTRSGIAKLVRQVLDEGKLAN
ncbi:MAG: response regulator, partial [Desulfobulbaceae bacterium]|nr:response regulator [Desulfobulbaceae bacterium]